jgi:peptidoglycan/LPS O-acetylase OafA/YrhL
MMAALARRLSRITSSGRVLPEVEGLRALAIGLVLVYHVSVHVASGYTRPYVVEPGHPWLHSVARHGHYGVQLFFVISGFILSLPFAAHRLGGAPAVDLRRYYLRRLTRLEPPYLIVMVALFAASVAFTAVRAVDLLPHLAASLVYAHGPIFGYEAPHNPVAWSLEIEVQFYLLAPLLASVFALRPAGRRRLVIGALAAAAVAAQILILPGSGRLGFTLASHLQYFLAGFLLADLYVTGAVARAWATPRAADALGIAAVLALPLVWQSATLTRLVFPVLVIALALAAFRGRWVRRVLCARGVATVGGMCYSIYLLHYALLPPLAAAIARALGGGPYAWEVTWQVLLLVPLLVAASAVYFAAVERPFMRVSWTERLERWLDARSSVPPREGGIVPSRAEGGVLR